jgi:hypothetical protein
MKLTIDGLILTVGCVCFVGCSPILDAVLPEDAVSPVEAPIIQDVQTHQDTAQPASMTFVAADEWDNALTDAERIEELEDEVRRLEDEIEYGDGSDSYDDDSYSDGANLYGW